VGHPDEEYDYTFSSVDPEDSDVYFYINWGDGTIEEWIGPYDSGEEVTLGHTWSEKGTYTITIKAKDLFGAISEEETLEISMPKSKSFKIILNLQWLLERFPLLQMILDVLRLNNR
jgi:hypothetical protein